MTRGKCDDRLDLDFKYRTCRKPSCYESKSRSILQLLGICATLIAVTFISCIIILECFVVIYKIPYVFPRIKFLNSDVWVVEIPRILTDICSIFSSSVYFLRLSIDASSIQIYYIMMVIITIGCVGALFYKAMSEIKKLRNGNDPIRKTALSEIAILFVIMVYVEIIFYGIAKMTNIDIQTPDFLVKSPDWVQMFTLLNAPVSEEISFRVLYIGIPAFFIALITKRRDASLWKYLAGGFEINKFALFLIFFSSFIFGVSHVEGWGGWKFCTAFICGLMLGYLFVRYGFYASVSFHFLVDYLMADKWLLGSPVISGLPLAMIMVVGIPCVCLYVKKGAIPFKNFTKRKFYDFN